MRAVNLLPHDQRRGRGSGLRSRATSPAFVGAGASLLVLALLGSLFVAARNDVAVKEREVARLQEERARAAAARPDGDTPARRAREAAVAAAVAQRLAWDVMLTRLARVVPSDVQLTTFAATAPGGAAGTAAPAPATSPTGAPTDFTMSGVARSHRAVARLLTRLSLVPGLVDPQLGSSQGGEGGVQFTISAGIDPTEVRA